MSKRRVTLNLDTEVVEALEALDTSDPGDIVALAVAVPGTRVTARTPASLLAVAG